MQPFLIKWCGNDGRTAGDSIITEESLAPHHKRFKKNEKK
jgi:hypothetical protein